MTDQKPCGPPPDAIPLSDAMKEYLPAEMWEAHARARGARKNAPKRPSHLSRYVHGRQDAKASHDVANRTRSARAHLDRVQAGMLAAMKAKLEAGELTAFGQEDPPFGPWQAIPAPAWRQLRLTNVRKGEASVGANIVHDIHILPPDADDHMPTGTPGRPTKGIDIIQVEFQRHVDAGEIAESLAAEARALQAWYRETYPRRDCPTTKTIENNLRAAWRAVRLKTA
ncbi:MAG: hypothetical protein ACFBRM_14200 [Pikeienuella sp.]